MALDGLTIANLTKEFKDTLLGGRISKIAQPEKDELLLTIKSEKGQNRLVLSASASLPLCYLTQTNKPSPITAPGFVMLLRKHIANGKITDIYQPDFERIIIFEIEHLDEMGDLRHKKLIIEIMGKHSNIIFTNEDDMIIDSIKHIPASVSSVREVLPGRQYFIPNTMDKLNPLTVSEADFANKVFSGPVNIGKSLYTSLTGISPVIAEEICARAGIDSDRHVETFAAEEKLHLYLTLCKMLSIVTAGGFTPCIIYGDKKPLEFAGIDLTVYKDAKSVSYESMSEVITLFYQAKANTSRIRQKSADLRKITSTLLDREIKKYDLQNKQIKDTLNRDKYRIYGELINTYGYNIKPEDKTLKAVNYYNNEEVTIPLDNTLTPSENANKYFNKYNKQKRTFETLSELIKDTKKQIDHLESIYTSLDIAQTSEDLTDIKEELIEAGYIRRKKSEKKIKSKSKPYHYISSDGFHMFVGKNNFQNEDLTFKVAKGDDWWFHAKKIPGSHVIVKTEGKELPDSTFNEAARLAAFYSKGQSAPKVEIDYIQKKHVKKVPGANPGFVIYHTNFSMTSEPDITGIEEIQ